MATLAPSLAKDSAIEAPRPRPAPVMSTTCSEMACVIIIPLDFTRLNESDESDHVRVRCLTDWLVRLLCGRMILIRKWPEVGSAPMPSVLQQQKTTYILYHGCFEYRCALIQTIVLRMILPTDLGYQAKIDVLL